MKKSILACVGTVMLLAFSPALAADFPVKGIPAPYVAPYYSWTGFYVGLNAGYTWGTSSHEFSPVGTSTGDYDVSGWLLGGTLGYNWQLGAFVFGAEADIAWSDTDGRRACPNPAFSCGTENTWLGTGRGRIGYAFDRWLPYFTAGAAFGDVKATIKPAAGFPGAHETRFGWTIGGGVEFALWGSWTMKAEYLYVDLGRFDCGSGCTAAGSDNVKFKTNIARAGVNYRF